MLWALENSEHRSLEADDRSKVLDASGFKVLGLRGFRASGFRR